MSREIPKTESPKALLEWSKWLISISFISAIGCIFSILNDSVKAHFKNVEDWRINVLIAIIFFGLNIVTTVCFSLLLSLQLNEFSKLKWYHYTVAITQTLFFFVALVFLFKWIY